jgi:hypothetical protein
MAEKAQEPFGFVLEPDGSVGINAYPSSTDGEGPWHHVGHVRYSPDGIVISSLTFEEMQNYEEWESHEDVDEAVLALLKNCIEAIDSDTGTVLDVNSANIGSFDEHDRDRLLSLKRSESLVREYSHRVKEALARSAHYALTAAVKNMLRVSTHDEVMKAVSEALVGSVMEG